MHDLTCVDNVVPVYVLHIPADWTRQFYKQNDKTLPAFDLLRNEADKLCDLTFSFRFHDKSVDLLKAVVDNKCVVLFQLLKDIHMIWSYSDVCEKSAVPLKLYKT